MANSVGDEYLVVWWLVGTVGVCSMGMQYEYAVWVCSMSVQYECAVWVCSIGMQYGYAVWVCSMGTGKCVRGIMDM
jgi:hypothetical protein